MGLRARVTCPSWPQGAVREGTLKGWGLLPTCSFPPMYLFSPKDSLLLYPHPPYAFWKRKGL